MLLFERKRNHEKQIKTTNHRNSTCKNEHSCKECILQNNALVPQSLVALQCLCNRVRAHYSTIQIRAIQVMKQLITTSVTLRIEVLKNIQEKAPKKKTDRSSSKFVSTIASFTQQQSSHETQFCTVRGTTLIIGTGR